MFDTLEYTKGAELIGIDRKHAEYQAQQIAKLVDKELVTKTFLSLALKELEVNIIKWIIGVGMAQSTVVIGVVEFLIKH